MRGVTAAVLAVSASVVLAGPARADQYDFITELDNAGVWYSSMIDMIDIGKELCHELRHGVAPRWCSASSPIPGSRRPSRRSS